MTEALYKESRPIDRDSSFYLLMAAALILLALIGCGLAIVAVVFAVSLKNRLAGRPEARLAQHAKDLVFTTLIGGVPLYYGSRLALMSAQMTKSDLVVELDRRQLVVAVANGPRVAFPLTQIRAIAIAQYDPRVEGARLSGETMARKTVLGTGLYVTKRGRERGIRLVLKNGEIRHIGLKDPEAFMGAYGRLPPRREA